MTNEHEQQQHGLVRVAHSAQVALRSEPLSVEDLLHQVRLIQNVMGKVMQEGEHYGTIPGCGEKKTLLQPGAQKLTMTFRLAPEYQISETILERGHKEYRVTCTLRSIQSGTFVGQGVGCCSTLESKYRYRASERLCPHCGKASIIKGKKEYGGGWLCFAKKGGCGAKWPDGAAEIESQDVGRVEHDNPADYYNTVLKLSKKRAFVDATITATAASDIFTQDIGDEEAEPGDQEKENPAASNTQSQPAASELVNDWNKKNKPAAPAFDVGKFLRNCRVRLFTLTQMPSQPEEAWLAYARRQGWIKPNGELADLVNCETVFNTGFAKTEEDIKAIVAGQFAHFEDEVLAMVKANMAAQAAAEEIHHGPPEGPVCPKCKSENCHNTSDFAVGCADCGWQWDINTGQYYEEHDWARVICPIPPKGVTKKDYEAQGVQTLGQIARLDNRRFYGLVMNNQQAKGWTNKNGKTYDPTPADELFAKACRGALSHMTSMKYKQEQENPPDDPDGDPEVPF